MALTKKKGPVTTPKLPNIEALKKVNNNNAGAFYNDLLNAKHKIEYESRDISLFNIRTNPDNEIFREIDDDEDIRILADDIKRNGLLHNLVMFPSTEEGREVYVLLSGERRYRALKLLVEEGDTSWQIVRNCNIITTELSDNEKKVLLYSANLQVRGGLNDEAVRRKAVSEFIECLQKEPYNMNRVDALKAIKSVSSVNPKTIDRDARLEDKLRGTLKELLDAKFLSRSECESYLRFDDEKQEEIGQKYQELNAVDCHGDTGEEAGKNHIEVMRDTLHDTFREYLFSALQQRTRAEHEETYNKSIEYFDSELQELKKKAEEFGIIKECNTPEEVADFEYDAQKDATKAVAKKEREAADISVSAVLKTTPTIIKKLQRVYSNKSYEKALRHVSQESRDSDIAALEEVIEMATKLKEKIKAVD
jgi:hypothetical protein